MRRPFLFGLLLLVLLSALFSSVAAQQSTGSLYLPYIAVSTPIPTATPTFEPSSTPPIASSVTPSPTATDDPDATPTGTPTATATDDPDATSTGTPTATATDDPDATPTFTPTPTDEPIVVCDETVPRYPKATRFGVQMYTDTQPASKYFPAFVDSRAGWVRVPIGWGSSEPSNSAPSGFRWSAADKGLAVARYYSDLHVVATLVTNPAWAATTKQGPIDLAPLDEYVEWVTAVVERYDGDGIDDAPCSPVVNYWEFYNEPDRFPTHVFGGWGLAPEAYVEMLEAVYPAVKAANPNAQVVLGGVVYEADRTSFRKLFLEDVLRLGGGDFVDYICFHNYPYFWDQWGTQSPGLLEKTLNVRGLMAQYGVDKPIMLSEAGYYSNPTEQSPFMTEEIQARYVTQMLSQAVVADVDVLIWFMLYDRDPGYWLQYGLLRSDDPPRRKPSFAAYVTALDFLDRAEHVRTLPVEETGDPNLLAYEFTDPAKGRDFLVAWLNPVYGEETSSLRVQSEVAFVYDIYGSSVVVLDDSDGADDGMVTVEIGAQPVYVVKG